MAKSVILNKTIVKMEWNNLNIIEVNISEIKEYENNPRDNEEAVEPVVNSIRNFGFKVPIILDKNNVIVAGHTRIKAANKLGYDKVPCLIADDLTEEQIKAFRLADNKVGEIATWDFGKLEEELMAIKDIDMSEFEFDMSFMEEEIETEEDNFDVEEALDNIEEPTTKHGNIYQLGNHRLMCGDSTVIDDLEKLMNGNKSSMVFTDPPYLMGFEGNVHADGTKSFNSKFGQIKNDKMSKEDGDKFIFDIFTHINMFNKGAYYVCFYRLGLDYIFRALDKLGNKYKALIIWNKGNHTLSNSDYMSKYEPIVYGWFEEHKFYGDRSNFDIWDIKRTQKNELHPTMKPIELCSKAIKNSSRKEEIILDLFGGSGSTLIASEQLSRHCYTMELDPKYCDVIVKRWEELTGQKAVLLNG